jgi:hypothetical protein
MDALLSALDDVDREVRYYGFIGLADLSDQKDWRPLREEFKANEKTYLEHWKSRAKKR